MGSLRGGFIFVMYVSSVNDAVYEAYAVFRRGGKAIIIAPFGEGKTTAIIPALVSHLTSRVVISVPYYTVAEVLMRQLLAAHPASEVLLLQGAERLCGLPTYFPQQCASCRLPAAPPDGPAARKIPGSCAYKGQNAVLPRRRIVVKMHAKAYAPKDAAIISDEYHIHYHGMIMIRQVQSAEELKTLKFFLLSKAMSGDKKAAELLMLISQIESGFAKVLRGDEEYPSVVWVRFPASDRVHIALTATPPRAASFDVVVEIEQKHKPRLYVVENVPTEMRLLDPELLSSLVKTLAAAHKSVALFISETRLKMLRDAGKRLPPNVAAHSIWGDSSTGVTLSVDALVLTAPWLPPTTMQIPAAEEIVAAQALQVLHRHRPNKFPNRTTYAAFNARRIERDLARWFELEYVSFDGEKLVKK